MRRRNSLALFFGLALLVRSFTIVLPTFTFSSIMSQPFGSPTKQQRRQDYCSRVDNDRSKTDPHNFLQALHHNDDGKKFAYAFVVGGCEPDSCLPYVLNAVVASTVLRHFNSTADIVFCARMSSELDSNETSLSCEQEFWLQQAGIKLYYLPRVKEDNFGTISLEKFRVFEMTKYDRVYFMDADLIPLCNIDHHMELSHRGVFEDYVAIQGMREPVNAGALIVTPRKELFAKILDIVHRHRKKVKEPTILNPIEGWGWTFDDNDRWVAGQTNGILWNFHGFQVDQGILYYWLKYENLNWSHILENGEIDTWKEVSTNQNDSSKGDKNVIEVPKKKYIAKVKKSKEFTTKTCGHLHGRDGKTYGGITLDTFHYKGKEKPWLQPIEVDVLPTNLSADLPGRDVWLYWLGVANQRLSLGLPSVIDSKGRGTKSGILDWKSDRNMLLQPAVDLPVPLT